jgi:hypothetical protein
LLNPISFLSDEEVAYNLSLETRLERATLIEVHIADIHFGALDPFTQYRILKEQCITPLQDVDFDVFSINGDLFDHKYMSNSDVVMYATMFVKDIIDLCRMKGATLVIIHGTQSHDANQLKIFYHYMQDPTIDIRIVEQVQFEYIKGAKVLCIPELYGQPKEYYDQFLLYSGMYDSVFMHGCLKGAIYGTQESEKHSDKAPIFDMDDFILCKGPIVSGHVHNPGCFHSHFYYCGSPYTWRHGESDNKGFFLVLHNLETQEYYAHFQEIKAFRYKTFNLDDMLMRDPHEVINYIDTLISQGIDYLRVEFIKEDINDTESSNLEIINKFYRNSDNIKIHKKNKKKEVLQKANDEILEKYKEYEFINDKALDEYDKLSRYINIKKGFEYTTAEEVKRFFEEAV